MSNQPTPPTGADLMARVGSFVLYWSLFEVALTKAIQEARARFHVEPARIRGGLKERLDIWADLVARLPENAGKSDIAASVYRQALYLRDVRNLIIHGLVSFHAHPDLEANVHIKCEVGGFEEPTGKFVSYTMTDLEHVLQGVDACRRAMTGLSNFNYVIEDRPAIA